MKAELALFYSGSRSLEQNRAAVPPDGINVL